MSAPNLKGQLTVEGMEVHDITDNDLFRFFLNEEELSKPSSAPCPSPSCSFSCSCSSSSSPDSSQSASMSSPEQDFESPPSSPFSSPPTSSLPFVEVKTEKDSSAYTTTSPLNLGQFWPASLSLPSLVKEEPKDILQSLNLGNLDFSSPLSLDMAVNALDQELKKRKCALNTKVEAIKASSASNNSNAALSREDLLKLSSKSLETYAHSLGSNRSLSEEEERQLKRQRRLIKNRESAQLSRQRKRLYIEELEKKVTALTTENNELIKQVALLTSENTSLREESFQYQSFIKQLSESQKKSLSSTQATPVASVKIEPIPELKTSSKLEAGSPVAPSSPHTSSSESAATVVPQVDNDDSMVIIEASEKTETTTIPPLHYYLEHPEELRKIISASKKKSKKRRKDDGSSSDIEDNRESCSNASQIYFCAEAQEIKTADKRSTRAASNKQVNNGSIISFLLPYASVYPSSSTSKHLASSCSASISSSQLSDDSSALLELYCQVLDTRTHSLSSSLKPERVAAVPTA